MMWSCFTLATLDKYLDLIDCLVYFMSSNIVNDFFLIDRSMLK